MKQKEVLQKWMTVELVTTRVKIGAQRTIFETDGESSRSEVVRNFLELCRGVLHCRPRQKARNRTFILALSFHSSCVLTPVVGSDENMMVQDVAGPCTGLQVF